MKTSFVLPLLTFVYLQLFVSSTFQANFFASNDSTSLKGLILIAQKGYTSIPTNETYPNDEYTVPEYWPDGYGQLTITGKQKIYKLGQSIASKYSKFLPSNPHEVYIQSFDDTPCFESAEVLAAGIFPPVDRWIWNDKLNWQPVKVNARPASSDNVLGFSIPCELPTLSTTETKEAYIQLTKAHTGLLSFISEATGWTDMSIMQFVDLYKTIILEENNMLSRPPWLNQTIWQEMDKFVSDLAYLMYSNRQVQRTIAGPLLAQISENIANIEKNGEPKVYIYVSQQPKLITLLTSLLINNTQEILTKPGSVIGLEIYQESGKKPYFNLVFNDGDKTENWKPLAMYGCNQNCTMDHFNSFAKLISPLTAQELCAQSDNKPVTFPSIPKSPESAPATNVETDADNAANEDSSSGGGWRAFLITILCLACVALIIFGVSSYMKNRQRVEYFFI